MAGQNLFRALEHNNLSTNRTCVFVSHQSHDKRMAREIARTLLALGVDIYFDESDFTLQAASKIGNDKAIVECIDKGVSLCTHLLGVITLNTKQSWWVPYEIGSARARGMECAHVIHKHIQALPSFIKVEKVIIDSWDLSKWVATISGRSHEILKESIATRSQTLSPFIQPIRNEKIAYRD